MCEDTKNYNGHTYSGVLLDACVNGYEQGRADQEKELQGLKDLCALYSEIRADERTRVIEEFREYLKTVIPCEMPQDMWNIGVDNTCDRMLKEQK